MEQADSFGDSLLVVGQVELFGQPGHLLANSFAVYVLQLDVVVEELVVAVKAGDV